MDIKWTKEIILQYILQFTSMCSETNLTRHLRFFCDTHLEQNAKIKFNWFEICM